LRYSKPSQFGSTNRIFNGRLDCRVKPGNDCGRLFTDA
jgi:hypothetical protein